MLFNMLNLAKIQKSFETTILMPMEYCAEQNKP